MLKVKDNEISLTRGDTANLEIDLTAFYDDGRPIHYCIEDDDVVIFTLKESKNKCGEPLIRKELSPLDCFRFAPEDTRNLPVGIYYYDVQLTTKEGEVYTVISPSVFEILSEVNLRK